MEEVVGKEGLQEILELLAVGGAVVKTPVNHTQKGARYGVGVHAMMRSVGRRENRMQRASFELLGGALFNGEEA